MKILDPGHIFDLNVLDAPPNRTFLLHFVKRVGEKYPGNKNAFPGTTTQEVIRALISRTKYVQNQRQWTQNEFVIEHLRKALYELEHRAAIAAGLKGLSIFHIDIIETYPICERCGHIWCDGSRHE